VYEASKSRSAERVVNGLTRALADEYADIESHLCEFLPALIKDGKLVTPHQFFGMDGYRYFDNVFPFLILFEVIEEQRIIAIQAILAASTRPPGQARV
jgi:hypothetical protein